MHRWLKTLAILPIKLLDIFWLAKQLQSNALACYCHAVNIAENEAQRRSSCDFKWHRNLVVASLSINN